MTWTMDQRTRLAMEQQILQREGFSQFGVYHHSSNDRYTASGIATSSSGRRYTLYSPIPSGFPTQRPPLYVMEPDPLLMADGTPISRLGVSHAMHTLTPFAGSGWVQICHWRIPAGIPASCCRGSS
jgi:hypothetical protein